MPFSRRKLLKLLSIATMATSVGVMSANVTAAPGELEKEDLKFGFIKLTDMAPLAIAYEKGFF
jgi:nitrate/nitrite transport system substrate-binding protein